jgi:anti-sigma B factor antagonist
VPNTETKIQDGLLTVLQTDEPAQVHLQLRGELDLANAATAEAQLHEALRTGKPVLVDLSGLEFLDSTGIALLVDTLRCPGAARLRFLPSETAAVRRLLSLTGLDAKLPFVSAEVAPPRMAEVPAGEPSAVLPAA